MVFGELCIDTACGFSLIVNFVDDRGATLRFCHIILLSVRKSIILNR